jgi:hypothetical protein
MKYIDYSDIIFKYKIVDVYNPPEGCFFLDAKSTSKTFDHYDVSLANQLKKKKPHLRLVK